MSHAATHAEHALNVLLVDDNPSVRTALGGLLALSDRYEPEAEAGSAAEALGALADHPVDLVVVDLVLPNGPDGIQLTKAITAAHPHIRTLMLSGYDEGLYAERALEAGARGYVMKDASYDELLAALDNVRAGKMHVSDEMRAQLMPDVDPGPLSPAASDLVRAIRAGHHSSRDAASFLDVSLLRVEHEAYRLRMALGGVTRASLLLWACSDEPQLV